MTQMNLTPYRAFWRRQHQLQPNPELMVTVQQARVEAERLGQFLATEFNVSRVYLFGSYAWGQEIRTDSDLDLAVEGLSAEKWVFAHAQLTRLSHYPTDLVLMERLPDLLRRRILNSGILVYDRQSEDTAS